MTTSKQSTIRAKIGFHVVQVHDTELTKIIADMEKYIVRKETEYGCTIYSIINAETGVRVNYYADEQSAIKFAEWLNK